MRGSIGVLLLAALLVCLAHAEPTTHVDGAPADDAFDMDAFLQSRLGSSSKKKFIIANSTSIQEDIFPEDPKPPGFIERALEEPWESRRVGAMNAQPICSSFLSLMWETGQRMALAIPGADNMLCSTYCKQVLEREQRGLVIQPACFVLCRELGPDFLARLPQLKSAEAPTFVCFSGVTGRELRFPRMGSLDHMQTAWLGLFQSGVVAGMNGPASQSLVYYISSLEKLEDAATSTWRLGGMVFQNQYNYEPAIEMFRYAHKMVSPSHALELANAYHQFGLVCHNNYEFEHATELYRRAYYLAKEAGNAPQRHRVQFAIALRYTMAFDDVDYLHRLGDLNDAEMSSLGGFYSLTIPSTPAEVLRVGHLESSDHAHAVEGFPKLPPVALPTPASPVLRLGFVSGDIRGHVVGRDMLRGMFHLLDSTKVELHCFQTHPKKRNDKIEDLLMRECRNYHRVNTLSPEQLARKVSALGIHVLVDLSGYTVGARTRTFHRRPAPVQLNWLGYPAGMGDRGAFDHIVTDRVVIPPEQSVWIEEAQAYMPFSYQLNAHSELYRSSLHPNTRTERLRYYGLPTGKETVVMCSLCQLVKVGEVNLQTWFNILDRTPNSVLWMLGMPVVAARQVVTEARRRGIDVNTRLYFMESADKDVHLERMAACDLVLDTFLYGAHVTATDALWMGTPIVTMQGDNMARRVASSLTTALGMADRLVTNTVAEYESRVVEVVNTREFEELSNALDFARFRSPLFDNYRFTRNFERLCRLLVDAEAAGALGHHVVVHDHLGGWNGQAGSPSGIGGLRVGDDRVLYHANGL